MKIKNFTRENWTFFLFPVVFIPCAYFNGIFWGVPSSVGVWVFVLFVLEKVLPERKVRTFEDVINNKPKEVEL